MYPYYEVLCLKCIFFKFVNYYYFCVFIFYAWQLETKCDKGNNRSKDEGHCLQPETQPSGVYKLLDYLMVATMALSAWPSS